MSLIKCPECGNNISEFADKCIYCGCPMTVIKTIISQRAVSNKPKSFKESLTEKQIETLNNLTKEIVNSFPEFEGHLFSTCYALMRRKDGFYSFVVTKENEKFVFKYREVLKKRGKEIISDINPFDHMNIVKEKITTVIKNNSATKKTAKVKYNSLCSSDDKALMKEISNHVKSITNIVAEEVINGVPVFSLKTSHTRWFWFYMNKTNLEFKYVRHPIMDTEVNTIRDLNPSKANYVKRTITAIVNAFSPSSEKNKVVNLSFSESLTNSQKEKIRILADYIYDHFQFLETTLTSNSFAIKRPNESYSLFWICKENRKMVFKYRIIPSINSKICTFSKDPFSNIDDIKKFIRDYYKKINSSNEEKEKNFKDFNEQEKVLLNKFSDFISKHYSGIYREYKPAFDSYKTNGSIYNWFWFTTQDNILIFKYRNRPDKEEEPTVVFNADKKPFTTLERIVTSIVESQNNENVHTKTRYIDLTKDIIRAIKGKSSNPLAKPIANYVLTETINNARFDGLIKKDEEFEEYRKIGRSFRFFDYKYNIRLVNEKDAKVFFEYYLASLIYDQISLYNKKFNNQIISNKNELLQSIVSMVEDGVFDFDRCQGVTSKFLFVPESTLLDSVSKYIIQ